MESPLTTSWFTRENAGIYERLYDSCPHAFVQQSVHWAGIVCASVPDTPYFCVALDEKGEAVAGIPLYHFEGPCGGILTSVPHAGPMGGIFCRTGIDHELRTRVYETLLKETLALASRLNCAACTIITSPFKPDDMLYRQVVPPSYILNNFCQAIYLPEAFNEKGQFDAKKSEWSNKIRKNLKKLARNDFHIEWAQTGEFEKWYTIHIQRHTELGATPLPHALLKGITELFPPIDMAGLSVVKKGNEIIGGCLSIWKGTFADYYMMSSTHEAMEAGANYALVEHGCRHLLSKGARWYNFQSSPRDGGVYRFKKHFGSRELDYKFLTWTFPGFRKFLHADTEEIATMYKWHYVAPFEALRDKKESGVFDKK